MIKLYKNVVLSMETISLNQQLLEFAQESEQSTAIVDKTTQEQIQKEAYEQGYNVGAQETRGLIEKENYQLKKQLEKLISSIPDAIAQNRLDLSSEIADIVLLITQKFFIENHSNPQALSQQINQILTQLNNKHTVELCLHPQEIAILHKGGIQLDASHLQGLKIKSDDSLTLGGFLINTNHGIFDASIEKQIDKLKEVLLQLKHRDAHAHMD